MIRAAFLWQQFCLSFREDRPICVILLILWLLRCISGHTGVHSYSACHRHHRGADPHYLRTKAIVAVWTLVGEGEVFGKKVVIGSRKFYQT